eukprot:COSAG02_NODE_39234_length_419_cov_1.121875_1_plen_56_part_10
MRFPAAYQTPDPFGIDTGGVNPAFWAVSAESQYDSWLSVGLTDGDPSNKLSSLGIN